MFPYALQYLTSPRQILLRDFTNCLHLYSPVKEGFAGLAETYLVYSGPKNCMINTSPPDYLLIGYFV